MILAIHIQAGAGRQNQLIKFGGVYIEADEEVEAIGARTIMSRGIPVPSFRLPSFPLSWRRRHGSLSTK